MNAKSMSLFVRRCLVPALLAGAWVVSVPDATAEIQIGDTRERVLEVLGQPQGLMQLNDREWLLYPRGQLQLEENRVVRMDIEDPETFALRQERERMETAARQQRRQIERAQRILDGEAERNRLLADIELINASPEARYRVWSDFQRTYPEVSAGPHLFQAQAEYQLELERRAKDRRIDELERQVEQVEREARTAREEAREAREARSFDRRYGYYQHPPVIVTGTSAYNPYHVYPPRDGRYYHAAPYIYGNSSSSSVNARRDLRWAPRPLSTRGIHGKVDFGVERTDWRVSF